MPLPPLVTTIDLALAVIALELVLIGVASWRGSSSPRRALLLTVLSGLGLLLALRTVAVGADPRLTLAALTLGGLAHAADITMRLRRGGSPAAALTRQP
ncbi:hypothetical protein IP69_18570 [Bosea sp. AAP35]|uniref:hypothetical protein n=1 Tax=Bosea sp. AAP35 TaxID=1523417 RepID=UPI0006B9C1E6|nr:hypothetical protein [Bosea sp. AAP35]KPF64195.1 hypothetical protein IP69_18570 [Bosea sp. AAP35]